MVAATWRTLGRYHALVAINTGTQTHEELHHRHGSVLGTLLPLIERGQAEGASAPTCPPAWHLSMLLALIHAGSAELRAGRVPTDQAEAALVATVLGAVASPGPPAHRHGVAATTTGTRQVAVADLASTRCRA